ncbi:putative manganese transporter [Aliivibrio fischeri]|uniref:putative manganese transporter n=1 Tax=Aliivibrio fischeri TaxID=668 RepID=UPI0012D8FD3C|nr:putative manganese transporter [Aliivibrio fischeri]MUI54609.1 hypothetical protein [Aliivibrio fischeri]
MMTTHSFSQSLSLSQFSLQHKRLILPITLLALVGAETTRDLTVTTLSDAFWAVSTYVAFTLVIYHYLSNIMGKTNRITALYNKSRTNQVIFSSLLGALPGCGGAIVVTTQYISGKVGFGSVVAVLTATMGDAAFLLIAAQPKVGFGVMALGVVVGIVSGMVVNAIHKDDFLRPESPQIKEPTKQDIPCLQVKAINLQGTFWKLVLIPATIVAVLGSFQVDINQLFHLPEHSIEWIGAILAIGSMMLWALTKEISDYQSTVSEDNKCVSSHPIQKAAQDTNFVSAWVIVAFLIFELTTYFSGINLHTVFLGYGMWMPLIGLAIGLLPGCGPQILVTSLYLSGAMPMSAQLSNAISNDGDALFPAIALAPKAAMVATFYSAVPAFVVGYGYYFLFEI